MTEFDGLLRAFESVKDKGSTIDTGAGMGSHDYWLTINGTEFYIQAKLSNHQKRAGIINQTVGEA